MAEPFDTQQAPADGDGDRSGGPARVLVVEHEEPVAELERLYLARAGFEVHVVTGAEDAAAAAARLRLDAVVLDLTMPGVDPETLYARVVAAAGPAVVVTVAGTGDAAEAAPTDAGTGETGGARVRVTRPFSPRVLVAAVREALRRPGDETGLPNVLTSRFLTVDPVTRTVRADGRGIELTATEFDLLVFMMRHPGRVYSREQLLATVWPEPSGAGSRTVDVHIAQLRAKLGRESPIRTVRGVGYAADAGR